MDTRIHIHVGLHNVQTFVLARNALIAYSRYFTAKLWDISPNFHREYSIVEAQENPNLFRFFYTWIQRRQFPTPNEGPSKALFEADFVTLANLWVLGHRYNTPMFQNSVIFVLIQKMLRKPIDLGFKFTEFVESHSRECSIECTAEAVLGRDKCRYCYYIIEHRTTALRRSGDLAKGIPGDRGRCEQHLLDCGRAL